MFIKYYYFRYTVERECNVTQVGGLLDEKGYGIAIKKCMYINFTKI